MRLLLLWRENLHRDLTKFHVYYAIKVLVSRRSLGERYVESMRLAKM